jgi:opacity protein-like surface antigen
MRILQASRLFIIISSAAAVTGASRADDSSAMTPAQTSPTAASFTPVLTTPTRSTPLSASQTSATPINGPQTDTSLAGFSGWSKPAWLSDLSFGIKESYDDNVLRVSGNGLPTESSWVDVLSLKLGFNLSSWVAADPETIQTFSLIYQPDRAIYNQASSESFTAHRVNTSLKGKSGDLTFSFDDAFLYNDGSKFAPIYALNQLSSADANQNDKYRNSLAHAPARERRSQIQDRYTAFLQYDTKYLFFRPISALNYINMDTYLFNNSVAPYKGYQDWIDRYDVNVGADLGFKVTPNWALTLGYRYGYQYQQQFSEAINSDQHYSSNHYQRLFLGLEGKLDWLTLKLAAGPDFRDFNPNTPISDLHTTRYYGEAAATANFSRNQSLTLNYKDYIFVSSTGLVPYEEYTYSLIYHWSATKKLGIDLGAKLFEHNYTLGNDQAGSAPSLRIDLDYEGLGGVTYALTPHLVASLTYNFDEGRNGLSSLPAKYAPSYRDFEEGVFAAGVQYRF